MAELARLLGRFAEIAEQNVEIVRRSVDAARAGTYSGDQLISNSVAFWLNINEALQVPFESLETTVFLTSEYVAAGVVTATGYTRNPFAGPPFPPTPLAWTVLTCSLPGGPTIPIGDVNATLVATKYLKVVISNLGGKPAAIYTGTIKDNTGKEIAKVRLTIL